MALTGDEAHHARDVLRVRAGDAVVLFDGRGREWLGTIADVDRSRVTVGTLVAQRPIDEPPVAVTLAIGLLKGDQMRAVIRDATMLGVTSLVPIVSAHTVRPPRTGARQPNWDRIAIASAKQCGRAVVPVVEPISSFEAVLARPADCRIVCVEPAQAVEAAGWPPPASAAMVFVGPEGGWSADELARATAAGAWFLSLGPRTLRAETAPVVALTALWSHWGWT